MLSEPVHGISNGVVCATSMALDLPAHMRSLVGAFACHLNVLWLLTGRRLGFLCLGGGVGGGCAGSSGSARVRRPHCWKSHATAHLLSHPFVHLCLRNFRSQDYLIE